MKKVGKGCLLLLTLMMLAYPIGVLAEGSINGSEQAVLNAAAGTFEYQGVQYRASQTYIEQLRSKLSEDGVDLTEEQAEEAINSIYTNISTGVEEGYLVPVNSTKQDQKENQDQTEDKTDKEDKKDTQSEDNEVTNPTVVQSESGRIEIEDESGNVIFQTEPVMKDTGYSMVLLVPLFLILVVMVGVGVYVTYREGFLRRKEE